MTKNKAEVVTIDGTEYKLDMLSDVAKQQLVNLQIADAQIMHLQQQLGLIQTARATYANTLKAALPTPAEQYMAQCGDTVKF